jgi:membrane protein
MKKRELWKLFKKSFEEWYEDDPFQKAAALAYYTLFSLAPLLIILIGIVGLFSGTTEAQEYIVGGLAGLLGEESAGAIREMVRNANREQGGGFATLMGIVLLLFGAGGVLGQFQYSLNQIWGVKTKSDSGWWPVIRARVFSYAMLLVIGFLLLVSLVVTTVLSAMTRYLTEVLPAAAALWPVLDILVSFVFVTALFAMIYKVLPDVHIAWKDVWIGAAITALLFALGKFLIGLYLGKSGVSSTYGAAGSLVTILLWVYYSALVFFFGAEVTKVYATEYGSGLQPTEIAETTDGKQSANPTAYSRSPR